MTKTIIFTIIILTTIFSTTLYGQKRPQKSNNVVLELGTSGIYSQSNELAVRLNQLLLLMHKFDKNNPSNSGLLLGVGPTIVLGNRKRNYYISTAFEYFHGSFEMDGKLHIMLLNGPYYYFEPQIGIYFKKRNSVLLLGYNLSLNNKSPAFDNGGLTLSYSYKIIYN